METYKFVMADGRIIYAEVTQESILEIIQEIQLKYLSRVIAASPA